MNANCWPVEDVIQAVAIGQVVIVVDSEDRENEGDFYVAAEHVRPEVIHFMTSHGRGHLCMPILPATARRLNLTSLVAPRDLQTPHFAMPVDYRDCKTGVSPTERAMTIRAMIDPSAQAGDFHRPGHVFPLIAQEQGVVRRPGHTEAAIDLARLAGLTPAGVLCEICSRDGLHMADGYELNQLAKAFRLPIVAIDDLIGVCRRTRQIHHGCISTEPAFPQPCETDQP